MGSRGRSTSHGGRLGACHRRRHLPRLGAQAVKATAQPTLIELGRMSVRISDSPALTR
jgi:hypothetical protein